MNRIVVQGSPSQDRQLVRKVTIEGSRNRDDRDRSSLVGWNRKSSDRQEVTKKVNREVITAKLARNTKSERYKKQKRRLNDSPQLSTELIKYGHLH